MEHFVSVWADGKTLPENYIFPPEQRPGDLVNVPSPSNISIPIIDLATDDHACLVRQIIKASQDYGCFQTVSSKRSYLLITVRGCTRAINHGVARRLMDEARGVFKEFFELPVEDKSRFCSTDEKRKCILYPCGIDYDKEVLHCWRDVLILRCAPLKECMPYWPEKPAKYREVSAEFVTKVNELGSRLTEFMCEGLGLEPKYFATELSLESRLVLNHYPPCPDPRLTLGVGKHSDRSLITILMQGDVPGLQIFKDGQWIDVQPIPYAFVINLGYISQIVSNGKLKNGDHRVVTNSKEARQSAALFIEPTPDCFIQPAKSLVNAKNPPIYRGFRFHEYLLTHTEGRRTKNADTILKAFRIN